MATVYDVPGAIKAVQLADGAAATNLATTSSDFSVNSNKITSLKDPTSAQDAATKNYVDAQITGLYWKQSCLIATATTLPSNSYNNGTGGVGATLTGLSNGALSVDGVTPAIGDRVLVKNESTQTNNGIYTVTVVGTVVGLGAPYVLTRATDFDQSAEINAGDTVFVLVGSVNAATSWVQTTTGTVVINTDNIVFSQVAGPGDITVGTINSLGKVSDGAQFDGNSLIMQTADATHPGLVSTGNDSWAGNKSTTGTLTASNLSGTNTGDQTLDSLMTAQTTHTSSSSTVTVAATDYYLRLTATTGQTANLSASGSTVNGHEMIIKDVGGNSLAAPHTITPNGADTIEGTSSFTLNENSASIRIRLVGTNWEVIG